ARLDAVAHGAETREGLGPIVAWRAADDAQRTPATEPQPLHDRHRRIVLAADGIDPRLVAGLTIDADRLGHRDAPVAHAGNRRRDLLGKTPAVVGRCRGRPDEADDHEGRSFEAGLFVAVSENERGTRRERADILEIAQFAELERHQAKLLLDRNLVADHG